MRHEENEASGTRHEKCGRWTGVAGYGRIVLSIGDCGRGHGYGHATTHTHTHAHIHNAH